MHFDDLFSKKRRHICQTALENAKEMDRLLGFPSRAFRSVHIAGTNGKGSTATKISQGLIAQGLRVGLFTSPHLERIEERFQINGEPVSRQCLDQFLHLTRQVASSSASFFEILFLTACQIFAEEKVEIAVNETGIGGRFDATNLLIPEVSVITSIGWDHMDVLGDSLEKIAEQKAGIIKPNVPLILGPNTDYPVFQGKQRVNGEFESFDEENSAIAKRALEQLGVSQKAIAIGIQARPPCRLEHFRGSTEIYLDGAHNLSAIKRVIDEIGAFPILLLALKKCSDELFEWLSSYPESCFYTRDLGGWTLNPERFRELGSVAVNPIEAFSLSLRLASQKKRPLLVAGSFYHLAPIRGLLLSRGISTS